METIAEYTRFMGIRVSEAQYEKFQKSKYDNFSDFARDAIDSFEEKDITLQLKLVKNVQQMFNNQMDIVKQNIVKQNEAFCKTIDELETKKENFQEIESERSSKKEVFEEQIKSIIPTLQRLKHGEDGLTNSNIEFQAKKAGVDTSKLKKWINSNPEIMSKVTFSEERFKCNPDGDEYKI